MTRTWSVRLGALAALAMAAVAGGAAVAVAGDDGPGGATAAEAGPAGTAVAGHDAPAGESGAEFLDHGDGGGGSAGEGHRAGRRRPAGMHHRHEPLAPYDERYRATSAGERRAADDLVADTRAAIAPYADPAAAEAAGYAPPRRKTGRLHHHLNRALVDDGDVLDPAHPEGLVYADGPEGPQLVGAFFVAPVGDQVPADAGDLVTWHSHDPACVAFWATAEEPCTGSRRMLHVWTAASADLVRRDGEAVTLTVVDPFGAPFLASVERAG